MEKNDKSLGVIKFFKYLLIINVIILVLFLIHFVRNIIILNDLTEKGSVYNYSNNFYAKYVSVSQNDYEVIERYYLPNKEMYVFTSVDKNLKDEISRQIIYCDGEKRIDLIEVPGENKKYMQEENPKQLSYDGFIYRKNLNFENTWHLVKAAAASRIKSVVCNENECYKISGKCVGLENNEGEAYWYIDKETGLFIREYGRNSTVQKDVEKDVYNMFEEYTYEFGEVKEEDFILPDLSEYEKIEF